MGKGDQRTRRGKINRGTFGRRRPKPRTHQHKAAAGAAGESAAAAPAMHKEPKVVKKQPKE